MAALPQDTWIWHPDWQEGADADSAGGMVHFRRTIHLETLPTNPQFIEITADTKYKLFINSRLVYSGPVKGDEHMWFYDQLDIQPYLKAGPNFFHVRVLRLYYATPFATSFARLPQAGLLIRSAGLVDITSNKEWETAVDYSTRLPIDIEEDAFLHIYESVDGRKGSRIKWISAKELQFPVSHGLSAPWRLSQRMIPSPASESVSFKRIHTSRSSEPRESWEDAIFKTDSNGIRLAAGTSHHVELEAPNHITAFLQFVFQRLPTSGSTLWVTYSECYEDQPESIPWTRRKGDRRDHSKLLIGPKDKYILGGTGQESLKLYETMEEEEIFAPFHFRTFRFLALDITVDEESDLVLKRIDLATTNYPLEIIAEFKTPNSTNGTRELWETSILTLRNCMHDCYEDCPFYEQLQYATDVRSSALFTYTLSCDDRMARQAIIQLHNSYRTSTGLTASRAPAHQYQIIPHFSLYWICMITDHFEYFRNVQFVRQFLSACDGVLETFDRRIDIEKKLVGSLNATTAASQWDFVDWTDGWRPFGIPPAGKRTGFLSYTNMLYAYTLKRAATMLSAVGRSSLASEYLSRADSVIEAVNELCFNGHHYTDGLSLTADPKQDLSQHSQVWAVLCGAAVGDEAQRILKSSLSSPQFTQTSISMSFYTLRAFSLAGGSLYNDSFHSFWEPWRAQLAHGVTTWVEDMVSQRSDCHAWGSSPIYEFLVEVAGIHSRNGSIVFEPRTVLFPEMEAKVPFLSSGEIGLACVNWKKVGEGVQVELELKFDGVKAPLVSVQAFGKLHENFSKSTFYVD